MCFDRLEPEKSSLPAAAKTTEKADQENQATGCETSLFWLSQNLGDARTRRNEDQFEESVSVVETGEIESAEKKTIKKAGKTDYRNNAESRKSESSLDIRRVSWIKVYQARV